MVARRPARVTIGCQVSIRSIRPDRDQVLPGWIRGDTDERVVAVVPEGEQGLYRLTQRTPLGRALLGHQVGDVVAVTVQAGIVRFEVMAIEPAARNMDTNAGVAEVVDAALLKGAPLGGSG